MEHYYNYRNKDKRLANNLLANPEDNRPFWATQDEKYFSEKHYDYYDPMKMDFSQNVFTGKLMDRQAAISFDMGYHANESQRYTPGLKEKMGYSQVTNYVREPRTYDPDWYEFTPQPPKNKIPDGEMRFANPVLPVSFDYANNNVNNKLFYSKKNYHDGKKNLYIPMEGFTAKNKIGKAYCGVNGIPIRSDDYVPQPRRKIITQKKMYDYSGDRRNYEMPIGEKYGFEDDYMSVSIRADPLLDIDCKYSLPLWNVADYAGFTGNNSQGGRKGPKK
jgi:hypothetical protein